VQEVKGGLDVADPENNGPAVIASAHRGPHSGGMTLATFRRKIAAGEPAGGIAAFAENCKVGRICN
jgi:hypothetical protein